MYLFNIVLLKSLRCAINGILLHVFRHVGTLNDCFAFGHFDTFLSSKYRTVGTGIALVCSDPPEKITARSRRILRRHTHIHLLLFACGGVVFVGGLCGALCWCISCILEIGIRLQ